MSHDVHFDADYMQVTQDASHSINYLKYNTLT